VRKAIEQAIADFEKDMEGHKASIGDDKVTNAYHIGAIDKCRLIIARLKGVLRAHEDDHTGGIAGNERDPGGEQ